MSTIYDDDLYIVNRDETNYQISGERLKDELGTEKPGLVMAFYQAAAPFGWVQIPDADYNSNSIPRIYNASVASPLKQGDTNLAMTTALAQRVVPIPAHTHAMTVNNHSHGKGSKTHGHSITDNKHGHASNPGGGTGLHTHEVGIGGNLTPPDGQNRPWWTQTDPSSSPTGMLKPADGSGGGAGVASNKTGITVNSSGSTTHTTGGAKTGIAVNNSTDNGATAFNVKYCNVILCEKVL